MGDRQSIVAVHARYDTGNLCIVLFGLHVIQLAL